MGKRLLKIYLCLFTNLYIYSSMRVNVEACEEQKRPLNPSQQKTEAFVSRLMWVLGTNLWYSGRIKSTLVVGLSLQPISKSWHTATLFQKQNGLPSVRLDQHGAPCHLLNPSEYLNSFLGSLLSPTDLATYLEVFTKMYAAGAKFSYYFPIFKN